MKSESPQLIMAPVPSTDGADPFPGQQPVPASGTGRTGVGPGLPDEVFTDGILHLPRLSRVSPRPNPQAMPRVRIRKKRFG